MLSIPKHHRLSAPTEGFTVLVSVALISRIGIFAGQRFHTVNDSHRLLSTVCQLLRLGYIRFLVAGSLVYPSDAAMHSSTKEIRDHVGMREGTLDPV